MAADLEGMFCVELVTASIAWDSVTDLTIAGAATKRDDGVCCAGRQDHACEYTECDSILDVEDHGS